MLQLIEPNSMYLITAINILLPALLPFILSMCIGPRLIAVLRAMKAGQPIREASKGVLAPEHSSKVGTPTMGGLMIISLILLSILLFADSAGNMRYRFSRFLDDYAKITKKSTDGVSGKFKITLQFIAALACGCYLYDAMPTLCNLYIPFYGFLDIGPFFIPLSLLVIIGASNAVNLTDGLDGLASGCMIIVALTYVTVLPITFTPVMLAVASACAGFLWFNCHPARVFMGDRWKVASMHCRSHPSDVL